MDRYISRNFCGRNYYRFQVTKLKGEISSVDTDSIQFRGPEKGTYVQTKPFEFSWKETPAWLNSPGSGYGSQVHRHEGLLESLVTICNPIVMK